MRFIHFIPLILLYSCTSEQGSDTEFPQFNQTAIEFDLSKNRDYKMNLAIVTSDKGDHHMLLLPFPTKDLEYRSDIFSTIGNHKDFTLVHYFQPEIKPNLSINIGGSALINEFEQADQMVRNSEQAVYMLKNGVERLFIYDYDFLKKNGASYQLNRVNFDTLGFIALRLPINAEGKEIENGKTTIPDPIFSKKNIKAFPGNITGQLKVHYRIPTGVEYKEWFYIASKSVIQLFLVLIEFIFLEVNKSKPRTKKRIFFTFLGVQIVLLILMIVFGATGKFINSTELLENTVASAITILSSILLYMKTK